MKQVLPNPLYYLENFQLVLDWVIARYDDVLIDEERNFIREFNCLPQASQALLVRMVMRKGVCFRQSKLKYEEIGDIDSAVGPLLNLGWVEVDPILGLDELFELLQKAEIIAAFALKNPQKQLTKPALFDYLHAQGLDTLQQAYSAWYPQTTDTVLRLTQKIVCDRLRLIFFGNAHQDWSEFVLSDLGIYRYEVIDISPQSRGFQTRRDIEDYLALQAYKNEFEQELDIERVFLEVLQLEIARDWIERRRHKFLFQLGQHAEKLKSWPLALQIYPHSHYPGARLRRIRTLEKTGQNQEALALLNDALREPEDDAEFQQLQRIAVRLTRKHGLEKPAIARAKEISVIELELKFPEKLSSVEELVREHFHDADAPAYYVENALINSLFGLLCWDAIFKPLPGAFFHPFHRGPVDLTSADFYARRRQDFDDCLRQLETLEYLETIRQCYQAKQGIQSPFVFWGALDEELLEMALTCIPASHLRHWFERILSDIKANRNGFPDLIQFWPQERRYQMIEVKGPGDRLQDNQKRLLEFCARHAMPIAVCYLSRLSPLSQLPSELEPNVE